MSVSICHQANYGIPDPQVAYIRADVVPEVAGRFAE